MGQIKFGPDDCIDEWLQGKKMLANAWKTVSHAHTSYRPALCAFWEMNEEIFTNLVKKW